MPLIGRSCVRRDLIGWPLRGLAVWRWGLAQWWPKRTHIRVSGRGLVEEGGTALQIGRHHELSWGWLPEHACIAKPHLHGVRHGAEGGVGREESPRLLAHPLSRARGRNAHQSVSQTQNGHAGCALVRLILAGGHGPLESSPPWQNHIANKPLLFGVVVGIILRRWLSCVLAHRGQVFHWIPWF